MMGWHIEPYATPDIRDANYWCGRKRLYFSAYSEAVQAVKVRVKATGVDWAIFGPDGELDSIVGPGLEWVQ